MILWLSGPTGTGKTSISQIFESRGWAVVREQIPTRLFSDFTTRPKDFCASLQEAIVQSRFDDWVRVSKWKNVVFDRSIAEDAQVFFRLHHESGFLSDDQAEKLMMLSQRLLSEMPAPDLIVYMTAKKHILLQRLERAGHPAVIVNHLDTQIRLYESWLSSLTGNVLTVDNSACHQHVLETFGKSVC
jgi:deoxyadenosine/deoxycytidine kinase